MIHRRLCRNVDNSSVSLLQQRGQNCPRQVESRSQVQIQHRVKNLGFKIPEFDSPRIATNRIHHRVDAAILHKHPADELRYGNFIGHIDAIPFQQSGTRARRTLQRAEFFFLAIGDNHRRCFLKKRQTHRAAKPASPARNHNHFF